MEFLLALAVFMCGAALNEPQCVRSQCYAFATGQPKPKGKPPKKKPPKNVEKTKQTFTDWKAGT